MNRLRKYLIVFFRYGVMAGCAVVSVFVLSSGYESVYSRSLPYVHTVDPVDLTTVAAASDLDLQRAELEKAPTDPKRYGQFGKPTVLKMPGNQANQANLRLDIAEPIPQGGGWLARSTALHAVLPRPAKNGDISLLTLYCRSSFRTINSQSLPAAGANIFVDTDQKWRYVYKVTAARDYRQQDRYVLTSSQSGQQQGKLLIACNDSAKQVTQVIEADLLSVQGAEI